MKIKSHNKIFSLFIASFIFMIFAGVLFFDSSINFVHAFSVDCTSTTDTALGVCTGGKDMLSANNNVQQNITCANCTSSYCASDWLYCKWIPNATIAANPSAPVDVNAAASNAVVSKQGLNVTDAAKGAIIIWVLGGILSLAGTFLNVAITLFAWVIDANKLNAVLSNQAIYDSWKVVRDLLNIAFILVLLFSAFASIFQASSYNYKKILLWLVIMALLVNFSFPITRFIIDVSNSLMYTILKVQLVGSTPDNILFKVMPSTFDSLRDTLTATAGKDITSLLASIIFVFILALTILAMGLILLIRTIALAIIIIFSPVAFVGSILSKGGEWWDNLFKYAMAGPMMAIVLAVSMKIMQATNQLSLAGSNEYSKSTGGSATFIAMAQFAIPITVLWVGIGMASKGIAGSSTIVGGVQKFAKGVGKRFSGYNYGKSQYDAFAAKRKARADEIQKGRFGDNIGNQMNKLEDSAIGALHIPILSKDARKRVEKMRQAEKIKDVKDKADDLKGAPIDSLSIEVNNSFDMGTGAVKPNITKGQAGSAQAFMDKQGDDRKTFIEDVLQTKGGTKTPGLAGSGIENLFAGLAATHPTRVAADRVAAGTASADELRRVTSYVNKKSEDIVNQYTK